MNFEIVSSDTAIWTSAKKRRIEESFQRGERGEGDGKRGLGT
jgi:hypothetical protein